MSDPRRNRQATATILVVFLVATGIAAWALVRSEPAEPRPPVARSDGNAAAPEGVASAVAPADGTVEPARATADATGRDAQPAGQTGTVDVRLRFTGTRRARVLFVATDDDGAQIASAERRCEHDEVVAELTVPAHDWIRVGAFTFDDAESGDGAAVRPVRTKLGPGERQLVELECSGIVTQLRLVGPSAQLLPYLTIALPRVLLDVAHDARPFRVHPGRDGVMRCHLPDALVRASVVMSEGLSVPLVDGGGAIDLTQRGGDLELTPFEPLLGIVVEQRGTVVPSTISLQAPVTGHHPSLCHVTTARRSSDAEFVFGWTDALGPFRVAADAVRRGDLWVVEPRPEHRLGQLVVTVGEAPQPASRLELIAQPLGGGPPQRLAREAGTLHASLLAGDYRLDWELNSGAAPTALEFVRIAAGETTTLNLAPLPLQRWEMRLQLPAECRQSVTLRLSGIYALAGTLDGVVPFDLASPPRVGDRGELISDNATFEATVTSVDMGRRRAEVSSTLTDAVWTHLAVPPTAGGRTRITLQQTGKPFGVPWAMLGSEASVPILPGQARDGCVVETIDGQVQLVRWFRVQAGVDQRSLTAEGRWTTLAIERPFVRAVVSAAGPGTGEPMTIRNLEGAGPHRLFVADGTRELHVDLTPGGRRTFDAALPAFVVR